MNEFNKVIDKLCDLTIDSTKTVYNSIIKYYNKIQFNFNKQNTIKKMYEPSIEKRLQLNETLISELKKLKEEENSISFTVKSYKKDIATLEHKIKLIQDIMNSDNSKF